VAGADRRGDALGEGEAQPQHRFLIGVHRRVPALGPLARLALLPAALGHRLQRQDAHPFLLRGLEQLGAKALLQPRGPVDRVEHRVKVEVLHQLDGRVLAMGGKAEVAGLALLARLEKDLQRPARAGDLRHVLRLGDRVELVEIHVVRAQPPQRLVQLALRPLGQPLAGLAGQKDLLAIRLQRRAQLDLGIAIAGRHVEIVDPQLFHGPRHQAIGHGLLLIHHQDTAETHHGEHLTGLAQHSLLHLNAPFLGPHLLACIVAEAGQSVKS